MKRFTGAMFLCFAVFCVQAFAQDESNKPMPDYNAELAKKVGADDYGMRSYVFVLLKTGPTVIEDEKKNQEIFAGHFANMGKLADEGILALAGPYSDPDKIKRGLWILSVETLEEAKALIETDPGVKAGIFDYELTKWYGSAALMLTGDMHKKVQKSEF